MVWAPHPVLWTNTRKVGMTSRLSLSNLQGKVCVCASDEDLFCRCVVMWPGWLTGRISAVARYEMNNETYSILKLLTLFLLDSNTENQTAPLY